MKGFVAPGFEAVRDAFAANFDRPGDYQEVGAALAAFHRGRLVVDLWSGWADAARTRAWERDTLVNIWSATKGAVATTMAVLVDRKLIAYDDKVTSVSGLPFRPGGQGRALTVGPTAVAPGRTAGLRRTHHARGPVRFRRLRRQARAPGARLAAGNRDLLSRHDLRLAGGRDHPPRLLAARAGAFPGGRGRGDLHRLRRHLHRRARGPGTARRRNPAPAPPAGRRSHVRLCPRRR